MAAAPESESEGLLAPLWTYGEHIAGIYHIYNKLASYTDKIGVMCTIS